MIKSTNEIKNKKGSESMFSPDKLIMAEQGNKKDIEKMQKISSAVLREALETESKDNGISKLKNLSNSINNNSEEDAYVDALLQVAGKLENEYKPIENDSSEIVSPGNSGSEEDRYIENLLSDVGMLERRQ